MRVNVTEMPVSAGQLKPGDYVAEYGGLVVAEVRQSGRRASVTEVYFTGDPLTRYLHESEVLHVRRPVAEAEDQDDEAPASMLSRRSLERPGDGPDVFDLRGQATRAANATFDTRERDW